MESEPEHLLFTFHETLELPKQILNKNQTQNFETQTKALIDDLKSVCANYGLGNDGNEFKIITQVFLYKFLNDKNEGHYDIRPTPFVPRLGKHLKINKEKNFKESLRNLIKELQ